MSKFLTIFNHQLKIFYCHPKNFLSNILFFICFVIIFLIVLNPLYSSIQSPIHENNNSNTTTSNFNYFGSRSMKIDDDRSDTIIKSTINPMNSNINNTTINSNNNIKPSLADMLSGSNKKVNETDLEQLKSFRANLEKQIQNMMQVPNSNSNSNLTTKNSSSVTKIPLLMQNQNSILQDPQIADRVNIILSSPNRKLNTPSPSTILPVVKTEEKVFMKFESLQNEFESLMSAMLIRSSKTRKLSTNSNLDIQSP